MTRTIKAFTTFILCLTVAVLSAGAAPLGPAGSAIDEKKIEDITRMVASSVVKVEARNGIRKVATGVVIDKDGFIVTTALISPRDEEISVITSDGKRIKAEFKGLDTQTQIALIQAKDKSLIPLAAGISGDLKPGAWIGVVGLSPENTPAVTQGIVSSIAADRIRLNVWVVPGSSGSPVVNGNGQMVGLLRGSYMEEQPVVFEFRERQVVGSGTVVSRAEAPSAGMALAVPMDIVGSIASDLKKSGKVSRGWLGVQVGETDGKVEIAVVDPESPAELAKLKVGDVLLKIDGRDITSGQTLLTEVRNRKPGQDVNVRIERDGKPQDVKVKLGEYTEGEAQREMELRFPQFFSRRLPTPKAQKDQAPDRSPRFFNVPKAKIAPFNQPNFTWGTRKFIGLTLQELNKDLAVYFGLKDGLGLLVAEVVEGSPAKKAGILVGDVLLNADGKRVESMNDVTGLIQDKKKGDKIKLVLLRDKKTLTLDVEIAEEESGPENFFGQGGEDFQILRDQLRMLNDHGLTAVIPYGDRIGDNLKRLDEDVQKKIRETRPDGQAQIRTRTEYRNLRKI